MEVVLIFILLVIASLSASMASARGRSAGMGFVAGICFGLLAVCYYGVKGDTPAKAAEKQIEIENLKDKMRRKKA